MARARQRFLLLAVAAALGVFLLAGVWLNKINNLPPVDAPPVGVSLPVIKLPLLTDTSDDIAEFSLRDIDGAYILNVWASWCAGCRVEHPQLMALAADGVRIVGLNYKDERAAARAWLRQHGNPYRPAIVDAAGEVGDVLGIEGVPETLLIDAAGKIQYRHIGILDGETVAAKFRPLLEK